MIKAENICKDYGNTRALDNVSFGIRNGEIIGFLGQNGAGKTTLMRIMTTYLPATSGRILVDGVDIARDTMMMRRKVGYLPETPPLYMNMTVHDYLEFAARLKDVPENQIRKRIDRVCYECSLDDVRNKIIGKLSKGYKQRVGIAQAIINEPSILILDEPTSGLDPIQVQQVRKLIKNIEMQRTVILSTHILSEIEQMAERVFIIKEGRIVRDALLEDLLKEYESLEKAFLATVGYQPHG
ncbi:MAG: ABC transporter ATP-binding protein [Candidatus Omnitrophica bacterium]|nr:ABC transporter ATP-binding protein [Candidatus Omnitrophota bacterium]MCB9720625.1 ABC transporter ATP-binding protein [Candidatus Omnitrophota bacterium]